MELKITVKVDRSEKATRGMAKELRFAVVVALTRTAILARNRVRRELPDQFEIRNKGVAQGIRATPATKRTMTSRVGSVDKFMVLHETGGIKRPETSSSIAVPGTVPGRRMGQEPIKRTTSGRVTRATSPKGLLAGVKHGPIHRRRASPGKASRRRRAWVVGWSGKHGGAIVRSTRPATQPGKRVVTAKKGGRVRRRKVGRVLRRDFLFVWTLAKSGKIKKRMRMDAAVSDITARAFPQLFYEEGEKILKKWGLL